MKLILRIAKEELRQLFFSPIAWFLLIAFIPLCSFSYYMIVEALSTWQDTLLANDTSFTGFHAGLSKTIFTESLYPRVFQHLYLFFPLLTMSIISKEEGAGTIRLLQSSPLKMSEILLGKYLSLLTFTLILILIVGGFVICGTLSISNVDLGYLLPSLLAMFLMSACYIAIGMYFSSLTVYPVISALATFLTLFVLGNISSLWQQYDFFRELTFFLSISGRAEKMVLGLITSYDLIYYLSICILFLSLTWLRMQRSIESRPWSISLLKHIAIIFPILVIGYLSMRPALRYYIDTTANKDNTIKTTSQKILADFREEEPLKVTFYVNLLSPVYDRASPANRNEYVWSFWERYVRFKPDIQFDYIYYYDVKDGDNTLFNTYKNKTLEEIAELQMEGRGNKSGIRGFVTPDSIRSLGDYQEEYGMPFIKLEYGERSTIIRTFSDPDFWPDEMQVSSAFRRLQRQQPPKALFATGNLERNVYKKGEREYYGHTIDRTLRTSLINLAFDVDSINLDVQEIPEGTDMLIVADPKTRLSGAKIDKIKKFADQGGNISIFGEPDKQMILNPLLDTLNTGVSLLSGRLIEVTYDEMADHIWPFSIPETISSLAPDYFSSLIEKIGDEMKIDSAALYRKLVGATAITYDQHKSLYTIEPLSQTQAQRNTFLKQGRVVLDSVPPLFEPDRGDILQPNFDVWLKLIRETNGNVQRISIHGDADVGSTMRSRPMEDLLPIYSWMTDNLFPVVIREAKREDIFLKLTAATAGIQKTVMLYILPGLLLLFSIVFLIRRNRQ
ncbi:Gldg family protein [Sphingobacterium faecale]|uniref:Gldg family protein n=1 Tax=Sphingobacterium faecale TaxID=2803775 RepID=A0ABS1R913_9SPHI|nr:Gldg family protein [Sphingobacterium faecale]MBL1411207.1 Gldg family protein [Sphingobacterium faecale]